jgi:hypothetical protein
VVGLPSDVLMVSTIGEKNTTLWTRSVKSFMSHGLLLLQSSPPRKFLKYFQKQMNDFKLRDTECEVHNSECESLERCAEHGAM